MSHASARLARLVADHDAARAAVGVVGAARRSVVAGSAPTRVDAERSNATAAAVDAARRTESSQRDETKRLNARLAIVRAAIRDAADDDTRTARLTLLAETIAARIAAMTDASFARPAVVADWMPRGRFANYARRFDLGFIGWDADDIAMEAFELLTRERNAAIDAGESVMMRGEPTATGSTTAGHTIGEGYRALRRVYRQGLGFYGYERRGTVIERDDSPRGYIAVESDTRRLERLRGEDESAVRAALLAIGDDLPPVSPDAADVLDVVARRRRALETLTRRFPLNADGKMLALAALLAEGYTLGDTLDALGITERTAERWAAELAHVA